MRIFIAINFEEKIKDYILSVQSKLKDISECGNFSHKENFHMTLVFIGETEQGKLKTIYNAVDSIDHPATEFSLDRVGRFKRDGGDIWWIGVKDYDGVGEIQRELAEKLKSAGFNIEPRDFKPHLTLARECIVEQGAKLPKVEPLTIKADRISVMKSERIKGKLTYTEIYGKDLK